MLRCLKAAFVAGVAVVGVITGASGRPLPLEVRRTARGGAGRCLSTLLPPPPPLPALAVATAGAACATFCDSYRGAFGTMAIHTQHPSHAR